MYFDLNRRMIFIKKKPEFCLRNIRICLKNIITGGDTAYPFIAVIKYYK